MNRRVVLCVTLKITVTKSFNENRFTKANLLFKKFPSGFIADLLHNFGSLLFNLGINLIWCFIGNSAFTA